MDIWKNLLKTVVLSGNLNSPNFIDESFLFNGKSIDFPEDYIGFCKIWGSGEVSNFIRFYCAGNNKHKFSLSGNLFMTESLIYSLKKEEERLSKGHPNLLNSENTFLLRKTDQILVFADTPSQDYFFWDLSTQVSKTEADIYVIQGDSLSYCRKIGNIFFEFVENFCLTDYSNKVLPKENRFFKREKIKRSFFRY